MSRRRAYTPETLGVIKRFFEALDYTVASRKGCSLTKYCVEAEIDKRHLFLQRVDNGRGFFQISWVLPLLKKYDISTEWLLFGTGTMIKSWEAILDKSK